MAFASEQPRGCPFRVPTVSEIERSDARFQVVSEYEPAGDQPQAIDELERRLREGEKDVVLLGATGTGKSATTAWLIERVQRPTLVMAPNKTLAAQLANELREMLPNNAVEYFVSYYDYYQPGRTSRRRTPTSRRTRPSTTTSNGSATRPPRACCPDGTSSWSRRCRASTVSAPRSRIWIGRSSSRWAWRSTGTPCSGSSSMSSTTATTWRSPADRSASAATPWRSFPRTRNLPCGSSSSATRSRRCTTSTPSPGTSCAGRHRADLPGDALRGRAGRMERAVQDIEAELEERLADLEKPRQAARGAAFADADAVRPRDIKQSDSVPASRNYSRHIDGRPAGSAPATLIELLPGGLPLVSTSRT